MPTIVDRWLKKNGYDLDGNYVGTPKNRKRNAKKRRVKKLTKQRMKQSQHLIEERKAATSSINEKAIEDFLMKNGVRFIREYWTKHCFNKKTNHLLFFDFWLPNQNAAIEFDGIHHFKPIYGADRLKEQKYKDRVKDRYCRRHNIALLRISCFESRQLEEIICRFFDRLDQ